ncbi:MAG TPA: CAP domain-containing protein [Ktedonobacteraceae bacterium]
MRRIGWSMLALLLLFLLAGCSITGMGQGQQPASSPSPYARKVDGDVIDLTRPTPDPTVTATATPSATPTSTPTAQPTSSSRGSSSNNPAPLGTSTEQQLQEQLFALINQDRAREGRGAYALNGTLSSGARLHSVKMSSCGMSHQCPGEDEPCQRVSNEGISWSSCGENIGYSSPNPTDWAGVKNIEQTMLAEQPPDDGHRQNLLSTSFSSVGIGIYIDAQGIVWITEDFAG